MKCPFKKNTQKYANDLHEEFGYCESNCMAAFSKPDGTLACAFIEEHKLITKDYLNELNSTSMIQE